MIFCNVAEQSTVMWETMIAMKQFHKDYDVPTGLCQDYVCLSLTHFSVPQLSHSYKHTQNLKHGASLSFQIHK